MTDRFRDRLSEYVDGELTAEERDLVERHLATCEGCSQTLVELRSVVEQAGELPTRAPPETVWSGIATRIAAGDVDEPRPTTGGGVARRRIAFSVPQLAAATVTLAALSAGTAFLLGSREPATLASTPTLGSGVSPVVRVSADAEVGMAEYYAGAIAALEAALFDPARPLPPETEARVRRALLTIDGALEDARRALEEMPDDPYLMDHVTDTMRRKSEFLRSAIQMARQS